MDRSEAIVRLRKHETELKKLGVRHLYLFGSTARGEARQDSDVDLFFDYDCKADIMTRDGLHKALWPRIEATAVRVF